MGLLPKLRLQFLLRRNQFHCNFLRKSPTRHALDTAAAAPAATPDRSPSVEQGSLHTRGCAPPSPLQSPPAPRPPAVEHAVPPQSPGRSATLHLQPSAARPCLRRSALKPS